ncbi:uncharacterized protein EDB93DRAFT_782259 [Suillus bovinus]|uniref:uncharacterized protein n=1 Tax=Suillus bovinus TaxID=48563 RepID=UPI001B8753CA|nr:uncharacterized protein EDB93DRAFT_782259 [Suillus bovinus]KAG2136521.1 hypothetical protein EDB93DRAFT_782259 [Suillus bovinus]
MNQSTTPVSSSNGSDYSNGTQYMPNTGMYMGQFHWPQPACIPHPGYAPAHPQYPYGVPANGTHVPYAPVAPSSGVGAGVAPHASQPGQNGCHPPTGANVACATNVGPYPPLATVAPPPQHPSAPFLYHQPFPSVSQPGAANPCVPPMPHQGCLDQHRGSELTTGSASSSLPKVPSSPVGQKHSAEDIECDIKRNKVYGGMKNDPLFTPVLDHFGQPNGTYKCSRDGMVLNPESYRRHIRTQRHLGIKLEKFKCSDCSKTYTRKDAYKRHLVNGKCGQSTDANAPPSCSASQNSTSSAPATPVTAAPTMALTNSHPCSTSATSMSPNMQIAPLADCVAQSRKTPSLADPSPLSQLLENDMATEPAGEDDYANFWKAYEFKDAFEK